jgi:hypothetical protein
MRIAGMTWGGGIVVALWSLAGCGGSDSMVQVTGVVTLDDKPIERGAILFVPAEGKGPTAGGEIKGGRYTVRVPRGVMKVSVTAPKVVGKKKLYPTPNSPEMEVTEEALPAKYNERTELKVEVTSGANQKDFALRSG